MTDCLTEALDRVRGLPATAAATPPRRVRGRTKPPRRPPEPVTFKPARRFPPPSPPLPPTRTLTSADIALLPENVVRMSDRYRAVLVPCPAGYGPADPNGNIGKARLVLAVEMGVRHLVRGSIAHHIDHDPLNNDAGNLVLLDSDDEHRAFHRGTPCVPLWPPCPPGRYLVCHPDMTDATKGMRTMRWHDTDAEKWRRWWIGIHLWAISDARQDGDAALCLDCRQLLGTDDDEWTISPYDDCLRPFDLTLPRRLPSAHDVARPQKWPMAALSRTDALVPVAATTQTRCLDITAEW